MNGGGRLSSGRFTSGGNIHLNRLNAIGRTFHEPLALLLLEIAPSLGRFELVVLNRDTTTTLKVCVVDHGH